METYRTAQEKEECKALLDIFGVMTLEEALVSGPDAPQVLRRGTLFSKLYLTAFLAQLL